MNHSNQIAELNIKKYKYIAKTALQLSTSLNSSQDNKKSFKIISFAYKYSCKALSETYKSCRKLYTQYSSLGKSSNFSKKKINKILLVDRAYPTLESLNQFISNGIIKKIRMRSALGIRTYPD